MLMHLRPLAGGNISVPSDTTPDAFAFTDQTNVALSGEDTNDWTWYGGGASLDIDVVIIPVGA